MGFKKKYSTEDLLLLLDEGECIVVLFINYQKAFNSVAHSIALLKLAPALGISGNLLEIIRDYITDYLTKIWKPEW